MSFSDPSTIILPTATPSPPKPRVRLHHKGALPLKKLPALSTLTQAEVVAALGDPNMRWHEIWDVEELPYAYERLVKDDKRFRSSGSTRGVWKSIPYITKMCADPPQCFFEEGETRSKNWDKSFHHIFFIRYIIDHCKEEFPVFEGEYITTTKTRAALGLLMKLHHSCKGRPMTDVKVRGAPKKLMIPTAMQVVTERSVEEWCTAWMDGRGEKGWGVPQPVYKPCSGLICDVDALAGTRTYFAGKSTKTILSNTAEDVDADFNDICDSDSDFGISEASVVEEGTSRTFHFFGSTSAFAMEDFEVLFWRV